jgi:hypothetical protein
MRTMLHGSVTVPPFLATIMRTTPSLDIIFNLDHLRRQPDLQVLVPLGEYLVAVWATFLEIERGLSPELAAVGTLPDNESMALGVNLETGKPLLQFQLLGFFHLASFHSWALPY